MDKNEGAELELGEAQRSWVCGRKERRGGVWDVFVRNEYAVPTIKQVPKVMGSDNREGWEEHEQEE